MTGTCVTVAVNTRHRCPLSTLALSIALAVSAADRLAREATHERMALVEAVIAANCGVVVVAGERPWDAAVVRQTGGIRTVLPCMSQASESEIDAMLAMVGE